MGGETSGAEVYLYVISCRLGLVKIGVADDPGKRLRELQVGSPVELKPMLTRPYADRLDAEAVVVEHDVIGDSCGRDHVGQWLVGRST